MKKVVSPVILCILGILLLNSAKASEVIKLDINVDKVLADRVMCKFKYSFNLGKNDTIDIYKMQLPFAQNSNLQVNILNNNPRVIVTYGFNSQGKGMIIINSYKDSSKFEVEFLNVELLTSNTTTEINGLLVSLDFTQYLISNDSKNIRIVNLTELQIMNCILISSNPKFKLVENNIYSLEINSSLISPYFIIQKPKESYLTMFIVLLIISIVIGYFSAIRAVNGKTQSIIGAISSVLGLSFLGYLFFTKVIPSEFTSNIDMISVIGSGIGICIGVLLNSLYNLIVIRTIEKQQGV